MKSKSRKPKKEMVAEVAKPAVETVAEKPRRRAKLNSDKVKKALAKLHPEAKKKIMDADDAWLCNCHLQNDANRAKVAGLIGYEETKCSICASEQKGADCPHFMRPLTNCRNGILEWLSREV